MIGVRQKSVTDTDSGMQQEHSRKSMFSAEEGGREGETDADAGGREGELRQTAACCDDFPLRFSVSELLARFEPEITALLDAGAAAAKSR